jgi:hypothetical protein
MIFNIGDEIEYVNGFGEKSLGLISEVGSDMDSYDEMELKDGVPYYASKKLTAAENKRRKSAKKTPLTSPVFAPVKPKNMSTVFLAIMPSSNPVNGFPDYIPIGEVKV